jgi:hypothetical protein
MGSVSWQKMSVVSTINIHATHIYTGDRTIIIFRNVHTNKNSASTIRDHDHRGQQCPVESLFYQMILNNQERRYINDQKKTSPLLDTKRDANIAES